MGIIEYGFAGVWFPIGSDTVGIPIVVSIIDNYRYLGSLINADIEIQEVAGHERVDRA